MVLLSSLSPEEVVRYQSVISKSLLVRSHLDVLMWLQGDVQRFVPHDIMLAAWGDFESGRVQHDVISAMPDIRSQNSPRNTVTPMLVDLHTRWRSIGCKPLTLSSGKKGLMPERKGLQQPFSVTFQKMRFALVHGINDRRAKHDCLYVAFRAGKCFSEAQLNAMSELMPSIDTALRRVELLPPQTQGYIDNLTSQVQTSALNLSERESEVLKWVSQGKTNPEIGSILHLSEFTVKNHLQRIFKKLNVSNRAQAIGKLSGRVSND